MKTELINETGFENKELIAKMIRAAEYAAQTVTGTDRLEVGLTLTDPDSIRELNREYRGVDAVTDVLSFPMLEFDENGDVVDSDFDFDDDEVVLGDIVISAERAAEQAKSFGHSFLREMAFLTVHSMLHLLGYDHVDDPEGEKIMIEKQEEILGRLNITRE